MDRARKARGPLRGVLTRTINEVDAILLEDQPNKDTLEEKMMKISELEGKLAEFDGRILELMLANNVDDAEYEGELLAIDNYQDQVRAVRVKLNKALVVVPGGENDDASSSVSVARKTYKLPKVELRKFNGDLIDWLSWWSQYEKIHLDDALHASDKYQYLIQATAEGSPARRLVESYPQTAANYPKVVDAIKERYGDTVILTELYVRKLQRIVIFNAQNKTRLSLTNMYDELEANIRALQSLGVNAEQSAVFLYPLVESSLPEDILRVWQRSDLSGYNEEGAAKPVDERLDSLMRFLRQEVRGAQRLAYVTGDCDQHNEKKLRPEPKSSKDRVPTAAGLYASQTVRCIFCEGSHESKVCGKASSLTIEDKKARVDKSNCCYACLRTGHSAKKCKSFVKCVLCDRKHHAVLCPDLNKLRQNSAKTPTKSTTGTLQNALSTLSSQSLILLQTLRVNVFGPKGKKTVRALVDSGSQRSYLLNSTVQDLGLVPTSQQRLAHAVFGGSTLEEKSHNVFEVAVGGLKNSETIKVTLLGQEKICDHVPGIPKGAWIKTLKKHKIWLSDIGGSGPIELLLGADILAKLSTGNGHSLHEGLMAQELKIGWTVIGKVDPTNSMMSLSMMTIQSAINDQDIKNLWELDSIGIKDSIDKKSQEDTDFEVKLKFRSTVTRSIDRRYQVRLPWINEELRPSTNMRVAQLRHASTLKKLKDQGKVQLYSQIFTDWLHEGIIELSNEVTEQGHLLPHRPVFKPESTTTPVRPVFDASAKNGRAPSLNECLHKGPNSLKLIPSILLRFRRHEIGCVADIRKAFQIIGVADDDKKYLQFLWIDDSGNQIIYRHRRVVFGLNSSPFLLAAVLELHMESMNPLYPDTISKMTDSIYVDNLVASVRSLEELTKFKKESIRVLAEACMELRQWEWTAVEEPGVGLTTSEGRGLGSGSGSLSSMSNVLGISWNKAEDNLSISVSKLTKGLPSKVTKRTVLSEAAKIFDPLGFCSPVSLIPKMILQQLWSTKIDWEEEIPEEYKKNFQAWCSELPELSHVKIPRFAFRYCTTESTNAQLHTFTDASRSAYAAVIYLRVKTGDNVMVTLMCSKSKVAPIKNATIPRLELLGCLIGARLANFVTEALEIQDVKKYHWTDSSTALAWIRRNDSWGTFVGNRVKEIVSRTQVGEWHFIPGERNPADLPSRGCNPSQLVKSSWWEGPSWLRKQEESWPRETSSPLEEEVSKEKKKLPKERLISLLIQDGYIPWYVRRFSSYIKNLRIIGWIRRYVTNLKMKLQRNNLNLHKQLSVPELRESEVCLFTFVQREVFCITDTVIEIVKVFMDKDGLIKVRTKLIHRQDSSSFRSPVLLPSSHPLVTQLIEYTHRSYAHCGVQCLMGILREKVWIIHARRTIKSVVSKCVTCKRFSSKRPEVPPAPLPEGRVSCGRAFEVTGVDLAGPLILRNGSKVWIVLFTCANYRAVHLELVSSLSTDAFLLVLQKFFCRRGRPCTIYSDNGTNFRGAANLFRTINWTRIEKEMSTGMIQWKFNPPSAAWWGGWWERLIRSLKDLLKRMLGYIKLSFNELESSIYHAESVMNSRPLTYIADDDDDLIALKPEMFLIDQSTSTFPEGALITGDDLRMTKASLHQLKEELKWRFRKEYLSQLVHRGKDKPVREFHVGEIVLVGSDQTKRLQWPMGKILEMLPGADGKVRVAKVQVRDGILVRPLNRLFTLEVTSPNAYVLALTPHILQQAKETANEDVVTRFGRAVKKPLRFKNNL